MRVYIIRHNAHTSLFSHHNLRNVLYTNTGTVHTQPTNVHTRNSPHHPIESTPTLQRRAAQTHTHHISAVENARLRVQTRRTARVNALKPIVTYIFIHRWWMVGCENHQRRVSELWSSVQRFGKCNVVHTLRRVARVLNAPRRTETFTRAAYDMVNVRAFACCVRVCVC